MKVKVICLISITFSIYLLWMITALKLDKYELKQQNKVLTSTLNRQKKINSIVLKNKNIINNKINLVVLWTEIGCDICKEELASKFPFYKEKYGKLFKCIYVGNQRSEIRMYGIENYFRYQFQEIADVFENPIEISQPFLILIDKNSNVLLSHEMIPGNTKQFNDFNKKTLEIIDLVNSDFKNSKPNY
ncbi:MAG: hypothetical protein WAR79_00110 [Melioribacteraceae bacterium]